VVQDPWSVVPPMGIFKFCMIALAVSSIVLGIWQGPLGDAF
jgi:hypothetical protein